MRKLMLFLGLAAVFALYSCSDSGLEAKNTESTNDNTNEAKQGENNGSASMAVSDGLGEYDFGGYEFRILTRSTDVHPQYIDSETINGELINDAIYMRNRTVEERFDVKIKSIVVFETAPETDNANSTPLVRRSVNAGEDLCDIAMLHMMDAGTLAAENLFIDWNVVPNVDLSKPWWDKGVAEGLTIGGRLYLNTGDFNLDNYDFTWGMAFNKMLWQDYGFADVYQTVKEGKWSLDYFMEIIKSATKDLDGDGNFTESDQWGFIAIDRGGLTNFMFASDQRVFVNDGEGGFVLVLNTPRMQQIVEKTYEIYHGNNSTYVFSSSVSYFPETQPLDMFAQNKGLIVSARIAAMPILRSMETDFGIIPQPKFDEAQSEYLSFSDGHASMMTIPKTAAANIEKLGVIIEALSAENYNTVIKSYYDINLSTKLVRDEESSEMLDIIIGSRIFDIGYVYNGVTGNLGTMINDLINQKKTTFTSTMESREASVEKALDKLLENFAKDE